MTGNHTMSPYRRDSNISNASFISDVEMAHDEVFAGPISESVPSSVTGFAHRDSRADSVTSFTYFQENGAFPKWTEDEEAIEQSDEDVSIESANSEISDSMPVSPKTGRLSVTSITSVEDPLLRRHDSARTEASAFQSNRKNNQKIYLKAEDLTIALSGFTTVMFAKVTYLILCIASFGLFYLLLSWLPHWKVRLFGSPRSLRDCTWVVIENQWREFEIQRVLEKSYGHPVSTVFRSVRKTRYLESDEEDPIMVKLRFLDYRYTRFYFHPLKDKFVLSSDWKDSKWNDVRSVRTGLDTDQRHRREQVFGKNQIDVKEKSIPQILVGEAFHPFYVFQVASLILWSLDTYYYYAACIFLISVISIITTLFETRSTMKRLRALSHFECEVRVLRNGFWRHVISTELVPGDVYEVSDPSLTQFPSDGVLLAGDCIINESMLTGESVPVSKVPISDKLLQQLGSGSGSIVPEIAKSFLYSGTKIIRARRPQDGQDEEAVALGLIVRTGFNTTKGALVRSMLFPKPSGFKFYEDAFRYISVMAGVAGIGFIASLVNFIRLNLSWYLVAVRALDLITIVVPPALPATLSIGTNFAISRLKTKKIFCISPQRVNVGGKLDIVCFDKTGTLTEDGLDVLGVRVVYQKTMRFGDMLYDASSMLPNATYTRDPLTDFQTCAELLGDPMDLKMFEFTGWSFDEFQADSHAVPGQGRNNTGASVARPPVGVNFADHDADRSSPDEPTELYTVKAFEFVSHLRRASVIVQQGLAPTANVHVYVKGAPECMKDVCKASSLPWDYEELLNFYTHRGFRVIACASKKLHQRQSLNLQEIKRIDVESGLDFIGFIIFENKLKNATKKVISELADANIRNVMCTGDNILTAISVGRECGLIDTTAHCFVPHFTKGDFRDPEARLKWQSVDNPVFELDEGSLLPLPTPASSDVSLPYDVANLRNFSLAITGDVFRWIVEHGDERSLQRMLVAGQIFARMSPDEKHELVEKLQSINYCCSFCGDGANDCGALKAADVGISLSEAEASVAAPFTSRVFDISCVPEVIREGRAALVTSFCCFKYMSLYSAIQFISVSFLYASASNLGDFQFLFIDLVLILPIAIFIGWTGAYPSLSPKRPTASLVSRKILTPLLGHVSICLLVQLAGFEAVKRQSWYIPPKLNTEESNIENSQNTTLFLISCFQYILSAVLLSAGPPFRQPMSNNGPFVVTVVVALLFSLYMLLDPNRWLTSLMQLTDMSLAFKVYILASALGGFAVALVAERYVFHWIARGVGVVRDMIRPHRRKKRKLYKQILEGLRI